MNRQHPRPHARGNIMLITITVSEILDHCQNLLDDPRISVYVYYSRRVHKSTNKKILALF